MTVENVPDSTDKVIAALTQLAQKLGTTAEHLWPVVVRQQQLDGIITAVILTILLLASGFVVVKYRKVDWWEPARDNLTEEGRLAFPAFLIFCLVFLVTIFSSQWLVSVILNPEYWALKDIARMAR